MRVTRISIFSNVGLTALKLVTGLLTMSTAVLAEAVHSAVDLVAALIAYLSVRKAAQPADKSHPYGHGKFDSFSGMVEGLLIFAAAGYIIYEALRKIIVGAELERLGLGFGVMVFSAILNSVVSAILFRAARKTESEAVEADALHLRTDVITSAGVAGGLVLIWITGVTVLDPIAALIVAVLIIRAAWGITRRSVGGFLDESLPKSEVETIETIIRNKRRLFAGFHKLRTRRSGGKRHADLHLVTCPDMTVAQAHEIADGLESEITGTFPEADVVVHVEPCDGDLPACKTTCPVTEEKRKAEDGTPVRKHP
ncbi:MAG: cation transporter [Candidatus Coatesbacteria bacterium]|nr:MAG: cation transporter [Candidatus Coatesbacteria bacterium]